MMGFLQSKSCCKGKGTDLADHFHRLVWSSFAREPKDALGNGEREEETGSSLQEGDECLPSGPFMVLQSEAEPCVQLYPSTTQQQHRRFAGCLSQPGVCLTQQSQHCPSMRAARSPGISCACVVVTHFCFKTYVLALVL